MGRIDFTPAIFIVGLAMIVILFKYMGGAGGLKNIMGGLNNFISSIFATQPVSATPTPQTPAPITPPAATPPATTPPAATPPAAAKPCAERVGEVCECASCCNGDGCPGDGKGKITAAGSPGACICKCDSPCEGGDGDGDDNDGGGDSDGGGDNDSGQNAEEFDEDSPAAKKQNSKIDQCRNTTGATHAACMASLARVTIRPPVVRIARIYNWGNA